MVNRLRKFHHYPMVLIESSILVADFVGEKRKGLMLKVYLLDQKLPLLYFQILDFFFFFLFAFIVETICKIRFVFYVGI